MNWLFAIDVRTLFIPEESFLELFLRGTVVYLFLFTLLTVIHKRHGGMLGGADFIFVLLIAASSHYALTGGHKSITAAIVVVITIILWNYIINILSYKYPSFNRLVSPEALPLIQNGKMLKKNMRQEFITEDELKIELRKQGITDMKRVKKAHIEADGEISFVLSKEKQQKKEKKKVL